MNPVTLIAAWALAQGAGAPQAAPQTAVYSNDYIGFSITHSSNWVVTPKKSDAWITIPLKEGASTAAVNVIAAVYFADTEIWQKSQEVINKQMELEIVSQWQEEILGVPMLLTKVRSGPGKLASAIKAVPKLSADQPLITLIGLLYTKTPRKLLFRLSAPEADYEEAEYAWRQALQTLRTNSGELPQPEDPTRKPDPLAATNAKPERPPAKTNIGTPSNGEPATKKRAPKIFEAVAAGRKVGFYHPEGWSVEPGENGELKLKCQTPAFELKLGLFSTLDSDPPLRALLKASAASLKDFVKVESRQETDPKENKAGVKAVAVWRTGTGSSGPIWTYEAAAGNMDFYFILTMKGAGKPDAAVKKALEALLDQASLEPMG